MIVLVVILSIVVGILAIAGVIVWKKLRNEIDGLELKNSNLKRDKESLQERIESLKETKPTEEDERKIAELKAVQATLMKDVEGLSKSIEELAKDADEKREDYVKAFEEKLKIENEKKELEEMLEEERVELTKRGIEVDALKAELGRLLERRREFKLREVEEGKGLSIDLNAEDKADVKELERIVRGMKCRDAVMKALYEFYYKMKMEMLVRQAGVKGVTGIYRIWSDEDGSYVGQGVDVGKRWMEHLERAVGVDDSAQIVLYRVMREKGVENFKWELVERCEKEELGEREKYWGDFYCVKERGLNKKLG